MPRSSPSKKAHRIRFPGGGLARSAPYADYEQSRYFTPDAQNVRPSGTIEDRLRGGSRGGYDKAFQTQLGSGAKVNMLDTVVLVDNSGWKNYFDEFDGTSLGSDWTAASWLSAAPSILPDDLGAVSTTNQDVGATLSASAAALDTASQYRIAIFIEPHAQDHHGKYQIFGNMNDSSPIATTDGWIAELVMEDASGTYSGSLKVYDGGVLQNTYAFTASGSPIGHTPAGWFEVLVNGTTVSCYWQGNTEVSAQDIAGDLGAGAGDIMGFGMQATQAGGICKTTAFRLKYYTTSDVEEPHELVVAASNGVLSYEAFGGMTADTSDVKLASAHRINAKDFLQKLYIADWGDPLIDTTISVSGSTVTFTGVTTSNCDKDYYVLRIYDGSGPTDGVYTLTAVASGNITTTSAPGDGTGKGRLERSPKIFDPATSTLSQWTATSAKGEVPLGARHIAIYRSRVCLAKDHVCYQSRVDDPHDFLFSDTDAEGATWSTATNGERGQIGDIFTALIPVTDDYMVYGCRHSILMQIGDLKVGGEIANITLEHGMLEDAWALGPENQVFYLSSLGLYMLTPGPNPVPKDISSGRMPQELQNINTDIYQISMQWDSIEDGLHIYLSSRTTSTARWHWWFDWTTKSFWPEALPANFDPFSVTTYGGASMRARTVLTGTRNGYIRYSDDAFETDEGTDITNYIELGPVLPGGETRAGRVDEMYCTLAEDSGDVTWRVRVDETPEKAVETTTDLATGTFVAGYNYRVRPRARGNAAVIRLEGSGSAKWSMDTLHLVTATLGQQRKG